MASLTFPTNQHGTDVCTTAVSSLEEGRDPLDQTTIGQDPYLFSEHLLFSWKHLACLPWMTGRDHPPATPLGERGCRGVVDVNL